jgi:protein SCO1/2
MRTSRLIALACAGLVAIVAATGCGTSSPSSSSAPHAAPAAAVRYDAPQVAQPPQAAPDFTLRDSRGRRVALSDFAGKAVLLTFIYDHCPDTCPLIVGNLHAALEQMGPAAAAKTQVIAVSVDPRGDTPKTVKQFLAAHDMTGRMEYLIGSEQQLAPVWKQYGVQVQGSPDQREVGHSAFVYGITGKGAQTALYPADFEPAWIVHDAPLLAAH